MINLSTCQVVVWGWKNVYHTHTHIHEGFFRALKFLEKRVLWLDPLDDLTGIDFSNTLFITEHSAADYGYWPTEKSRKSSFPIVENAFYVVHGLNESPELAQALQGKVLNWNVFLNCPPAQAGQEQDVDREVIWLAEDTPFYPKEKKMDFRWATDLLPHEIEANKPSRVFRDESHVINWVGTVWHVNDSELTQFKKACDENGIKFNHIGAGQHGVVSIEENVRLIKESYMAPAISGTHHLTEGYAPCRIFKNISYGQFGITNSRYVNAIFGDKLIFNSDPYQLFYEARERLPHVALNQLHALMDEVAAKHTYLNRLDAIFKAVELVMEGER